jgi:hypothetical protein
LDGAFRHRAFAGDVAHALAGEEAAPGSSEAADGWLSMRSSSAGSRSCGRRWRKWLTRVFRATRTSLRQDRFVTFGRCFPQDRLNDIEAVKETCEICEILASPQFVRMFGDAYVTCR